MDGDDEAVGKKNLKLPRLAGLGFEVIKDPMKNEKGVVLVDIDFGHPGRVLDVFYGEGMKMEDAVEKVQLFRRGIVHIDPHAMGVRLKHLSHLRGILGLEELPVFRAER